MSTIKQNTVTPTVLWGRPLTDWLRLSLVVFGVLNLILAAGYFWQQPWATNTWPWPDGRLTYIFIAAIIAAIAAALIWLGLTGVWRPMAAGALNLVVMMGGMAFYFFYLYGQRGESRLLAYAVGAAVLAIVNVQLFFWAHRLSVLDSRPTPRPVLISYVLFCLVLVAIAIALFRRAPNTMPWPLNPDTSILIGLIFFSDAFYFLYALLYPHWSNAVPSLLSFLAYDVVLIGPLLAHLSQVQPAYLPSLIVYTAVLLYSGALAIYYLFIHRETRLGRKTA